MKFLTVGEWCPKCDMTINGAARERIYVPARLFGLLPEYLFCQCLHCGFTWREAPKEKP